MRTAPPLALLAASLGAALLNSIMPVNVLSAWGASGCFCGQPISGVPDAAPDHPLATDCLFILNVGIGLQTCDPVCICDVDATGGTPNSTDALMCLRAAVGMPGLLSCACAEPPCQTTAACSEMEVRVLPDSELDVGWSGDGHNIPLVEGAAMLLRVIRRCGTSGDVCELDSDCTDGDLCEPTCECDEHDVSPCEVTGPVAGQKRCYRETHRMCEADGDCPVPQTCETLPAPPVPLSASGTPLCVTTYLDEDITGRVDPSLGTVELSARVRYRANLGVSLSMPCPRCGPRGEAPAVGDGFVCEGGPRDGKACVVGAVSPIFGGTSFDCPPALMTATGIELALHLSGVTTGTRTLDATIPCGGSLAALHPDTGHGVCLDTFTACTSNDDCRRCTGLPSQACATNEDCSGVGACAAAPEQPIACGIYCHCGFCDGDLNAPCASDTECGAGETCKQGSNDTQQLQNNKCVDLTCGLGGFEQCCAAGDASCANPTALIGECADQPYRGCSNDSDCTNTGATGPCILSKWPCFEGRIQRSGSVSPLAARCIDDPDAKQCSTNADCAAGACVADAAAPTVVATFCASPTQSASINRAFGLAGPAAMTLKTTVRVHRCGDGKMGGSEECDDRNMHSGDGCDEICRVER